MSVNHRMATADTTSAHRLGQHHLRLVQHLYDTTTEAIRPLTGGVLSPGQTFSVDLGLHRFRELSGSVGLNLRSGTGAESLTLFTDGCQLGVQRSGGAEFDIGTAAANTAYHFTLTYNGGNSYSFTLTGASPGDNFMANNDLTGIDNIRFFNFNQGADKNFGFDNLAIVPEPSTLALLAGPGFLAGWFFLRRRRVS